MILNVYKPRGWTSNDVVQKIKHSCGFKKVGHAGTLDPLAEGVLLVLTDVDTKKQSKFMGLDKQYLVRVAFGYTSDSYDLGTQMREDGRQIASGLTSMDLQSVLLKYIGAIEQQVPAYSAVHVDGNRLYELARTNTVLEKDLPVKKIQFYDIKVTSFKNNEQIFYPELKPHGEIVCTTAEILVNCGKGTYIRSLVRDIGNDLKCGAVAVSLVRQKIGDYSIEQSLTIDEVLLKHLKS